MCFPRNYSQNSFDSPRACFGNSGTEPGQFQKPWGIEFDIKNRRLLVAGRDNNRIQILNENGAFISSFGQKGHTNGSFLWPRGLGIQEHTNNIIVTEYGTHRVQLFSEQGDFLFAVGGENMFYNPCGVASNRKGEVIVADLGHDKVQILDSKVQYLRSFGGFGSSPTGLNTPWDVTADKFGRLYVADFRNNRISIWNEDGSQALKTVKVNRPVAVCCDQQNNLIVVSYSQSFSDNGSKFSYSLCVLDGNTYQELRKCTGEDSFLFSACVDDDNRIWAANTSHDKILMF